MIVWAYNIRLLTMDYRCTPLFLIDGLSQPLIVFVKLWVQEDGAGAGAGGDNDDDSQDQSRRVEPSGQSSTRRPLGFIPNLFFPDF